MDHGLHHTQPTHQRLPRWKRLLLCLALVCAVGLYSLEATHNHRNVADELHCPVCHVVGHNALNSYKPNTDVLLSLSGWYAATPALHDAAYVQHPFDLKPRTRAPPAPASHTV
jgi:hypothetical protein